MRELNNSSKELLYAYSVPSRHKIDGRISRRNFLRAAGMSAVGATALAYVNSHIPRPVRAYSGDTAVAQVLKYPVTIDGTPMTSPEEWNDEGVGKPGEEGDRAVGSQSLEGLEGIFKFKWYPGDALYFWGASLGDKKINRGDSFVIALTKNAISYSFDMERKNGSSLKYEFWRGTLEHATEEVPDAISWTKIEEVPDANFSGQSSIASSMYSQDSCVNFEGKIDMKFFEDIKPDKNGKIRVPMSAYLYDPGQNAYAKFPWKTTNINRGSTWGYLEFDPTVISEFPILQYGSVAGISVLSALLAKKLVSKDRITRREFFFRKP